jgi:hypothetical protein
VFADGHWVEGPSPGRPPVIVSIGSGEPLSSCLDLPIAGEVATTWSFAIDDRSKVHEAISEAQVEVARLGRQIVGEPLLAEVVDARGVSTWWISVSIEARSSVPRPGERAERERAERQGAYGRRLPPERIRRSS